MRSLHIRVMPEDERPIAEGWLRANAKNGFDPAVLRYARMLSVFDHDTGMPRLYVPVQPLFMLESLGPAPDMTPLEMAEALKRVVHTVAWEGRNVGHGELLFAASEPTVQEFAGRHGFEVLQYPVLRMRLG